MGMDADPNMIAQFQAQHPHLLFFFWVGGDVRQWQWQYTTLLDRHGMEVHSVTLIDRRTLLENGEKGRKHWLRMFGAKRFHRLHHEEAEVEDYCRQHNASVTIWQHYHFRLGTSYASN